MRYPQQPGATHARLRSHHANALLNATETHIAAERLDIAAAGHATRDTSRTKQITHDIAPTHQDTTEHRTNQLRDTTRENTRVASVGGEDGGNRGGNSTKGPFPSPSFLLACRPPARPRCPCPAQSCHIRAPGYPGQKEFVDPDPPCCSPTPPSSHTLNSSLN